MRRFSFARLRAVCAAVFMLPAVAACASLNPFDGQVSNRSVPQGFAAEEYDARYVSVQPGDTLQSIADRHGVNAQELADLNGLRGPRDLKPGRELILPVAPAPRVARAKPPSGNDGLPPVRRGGETAQAETRTPAAVHRAPVEASPVKPVKSVQEQELQPDERGARVLTLTRKTDDAPAAKPVKTAAGTQTGGQTVLHTVAKGEQVGDIADRYGVREVDIILANAMKPPYALHDGERIRVPVPLKASDDAVTEAPAIAGAAPVPTRKPQGLRHAAASPSAPAKKASAELGLFDWPVTGRVISGFGDRGNGLVNDGINIAVASGTPVRAAADGVVRYAGNELRGFGNLVLIEHETGHITAYAHNDKIKVARGDKVRRGSVIALAGQTGNVSSPQVHFEIRKGQTALDPARFLVAMN